MTKYQFKQYDAMMKFYFKQYIIDIQMEKTLNDIVLEASNAERNLVESSSSSEDSSSDSETENYQEQQPKNPQLYTLSNTSIDVEFTEGSILVTVAETTTIQPLQTYQLKSQILFEDDLSNFAVLFKTHSKLINSSPLVFQRSEYFLKPSQKEQFSIQVTNSSQESIKLSKGTSIGYIFLYPFFKKNGCKSKNDRSFSRQ